MLLPNVIDRDETTIALLAAICPLDRVDFPSGEQSAEHYSDHFR